MRLLLFNKPFEVLPQFTAADDRRTLGRIPAEDKKTLAHLLNMDRTPVGSIGDIVTANDGVPEWRVA